MQQLLLNVLEWLTDAHECGVYWRKFHLRMNAVMKGGERYSWTDWGDLQ